MPGGPADSRLLCSGAHMVAGTDFLPVAPEEGVGLGERSAVLDCLVSRLEPPLAGFRVGHRSPHFAAAGFRVRCRCK